LPRQSIQQIQDGLDIERFPDDGIDRLPHDFSGNIIESET